MPVPTDKRSVSEFVDRVLWDIAGGWTDGADVREDLTLHTQFLGEANGEGHLGAASGVPQTAQCVTGAAVTRADAENP